MYVYHIIESKIVLEESPKYFSPVSLDTDGFIHLSHEFQVEKVANSLYAREKVLYVLKIKTKLLEDLDKLVEEDLYELKETYPHYYGPINKDAIVDIKKIQRGEGIFTF